MFEEIFFPRTAERYRAAPLVEQRERYLVHLRETGSRRPTLRQCANDQLSLVRLLNLKEDGGVRLSQIEAVTAPPPVCQALALPFQVSLPGSPGGCRAGIAPTRLGIRMRQCPTPGIHFGQGDGRRECTRVLLRVLMSPANSDGSFSRKQPSAVCLGAILAHPTGVLRATARLRPAPPLSGNRALKFGKSTLIWKIVSIDADRGTSRRQPPRGAGRQRPDLPIAQDILASMRLDQHPGALPSSSYFPGAGI